MSLLAAVCAALAVVAAQAPGRAVDRRLRILLASPPPPPPAVPGQVWWRPRGAARRTRERLVAEAPLVLDLLGACLAGGSSLSRAAAAAAQAMPGPCADRLERVLAALAVGTAPADAWLRLGAGPDDPLAAAARLLAAAAESGAPLAEVVGRLAAESRAVARGSSAAAARRAGVLAVAPLGLCFLPAFVLVGVVPVVAGLVQPLLAGP